ncbi:hypothetical protein EJ04DRAFT_303340 [Polyplosphaeria fusca]|uniref:Uncharacterized protein n=1 Tax=Polyplosphaeria fusca TaxID=682080 RepID=A0A9P4QXH1_9PLEO|nr:hypothetical protein EJ04DRAFT_303340 [Polyplosphaeria fusca]
MGDTLLPPPPSSSTFGTSTPSGLTPNTRSEAEAALTLNSSAQTDSAAPTTPLASSNPDEATKAYRNRPAGPLRASSTNYQEALYASQKKGSVSSNMSSDTSMPDSSENLSGVVASPTTTLAYVPKPGEGVVPLHNGVGTGQAEAVRRARKNSVGLNLGSLGRMPSWSEQDFKHVASAGLMGEVRDGAGYSSGVEGKDVK